MTDAELRADLIAKGLLRPVGSRHTVCATDFAGRRSAARDILLEEGSAVAAGVVDNPYADPVVRALLQRWLGQQEAA